MTKTFKKPVAFISAAVMVMTMLLYFPSGMFSIDFGLKASAAETITPSQPNVGDGSSDNPYQIDSPEELYWFAAQVNGGSTSINAVLTDNITVNSNVLNADGTLNSTNSESFTSWTPIGNGSKKYTGTFDGQNHTISGLYFSDTSNYVGLFGYVGENGSVSNVGVMDSYFNAKQYVGGVCGQNYYGTITNCYNKGTVSATIYSSASLGGVCGQNYYGTITDCYNIGTVIGSAGSIQVGGVCGYNDSGTIENCYNTGAVNGSGQVGGVCGQNHAYSGTATITNCYNTGEVSGTNNVGGVCGNIDTSNGTVTIANCYNKGEVSATGNNANVGGVCGENYYGTITNCYSTGKVSATGENVCVGGVCGNNSGYNDSGTIENCYNTGAVNGSGKVGGVCGWNTHIITNCYFLSGTATKGIGEDSASGSAESKTTYEMHTADFCVALGYHSQFDENGFCGLCKNGYQPASKTTHKYNIDGVEGFDEVYEISNLGQLYWFADKVNTDNTNFGSANAVLTKDITVNSNVLSGNGGLNSGTFKDWTPIGKGVNSSKKYTGTFDGQNHTISGLYFNNTDTITGNDVGLFGFVGSGGKVSNVGVVDSYFKGASCVGGVCGSNDGTITNCYNKGTVIGCSDKVGGVCGYNWANYGTATIINCYNTGKVSATGNSSSVGGVCGFNSAYNETATIKNCYNTGEVSATGKTASVGGVCGVNSADSGKTAEITNCYNTGAVNGSGQVGGVCGYNDSGTIANCYNTGNVTGNVTATGETASVGGVCGYNYAYSGTATITNCYNTGAVNGSGQVGGVCGYNWSIYNQTATIKNCYNTGNVTATGETASVGGVCGENYAYSGTATIANCYNTGKVNGSGKVGGVCGYNWANNGNTAEITKCYYLSGKATGGINGTDLNGSAELKTETQFNSGEVAYLLSQGENGSVWGQTLGTDDYPVLGGKKVLGNIDQSAFANDVIIYGQNAALDGTIDFNIYVAADDNYEWSAKIDGAEVTKPAKDENGLYKFTCEVAAKDMAKNITFSLSNGDSVTVSVKTYLDALDTSESTELEELVTAMETYGTAADAFFSNGTVEAVEGVTAETLSGYAFTKNDAPEGISYYGSSLLLKSETTVRHYFKLAEGKSIGEFTFTVDGNTVTPVEKQGYYYIDIENISADKLGTPHTVKIGDIEVISNYSALSYAKTVLDNNTADDNLKNLVKTLYLYNQNALAYINAA